MATELLSLKRTAPKHNAVHVLDGGLVGTCLPDEGLLIAHALSSARPASLAAGRAFAFSAQARLDPSQLAALRDAAAEHAHAHGELPEAPLAPALSGLRDALLRALPADSGMSLSITAASRRFGICLHLPCDGSEATLNATGLGIGVWSLRCQQPVHATVIGNDARAASGLDYRQGSGEEGLPAITAVCGERAIDGIPVWFALTARGAALADPAMAAAGRALLEALLRALTTEVVPSWQGRRARLFRAEALADQDEDIRLLPLQLLLAPPWTRRAVQVLGTGLLLMLVALFVPVRDRLGTTARLGLDGVVTLTATAPGQVLSVYASPGRHLDAGAPLALISNSVASSTAESDYADYVALLRRRLAHTDAAGADPALAQAWERLQQARAAAQPELQAPRNGHLLDLAVTRGQQVVAGQTLMQFAPDDSSAQLDLDLPGRAASELRAGSPGSVRLASMPDREFPIRVVWVAQAVAGDSGTTSSATAAQTHARAIFVGAQPASPPGTHADVRIDLGTQPLFRLLYRRWKEG